MGLASRLPAPAALTVFLTSLLSFHVHLADAVRLLPASVTSAGLEKASPIPSTRKHVTDGYTSGEGSARSPLEAEASKWHRRPGARDCTTYWMTQDLDHFSWRSLATFKQRYLVYDAYWAANGPIFFYTGNEADVELYADHTGLMWENAEAFGALIVFAEHRYYGKSQPFVAEASEGSAGGGDPSREANNHPGQLHFLTHEQALADYATLIAHLKSKAFKDGTGAASPVIAFGGSYGGMLSAWMRLKYPGSVAGAVAASAPVLAFPGMAPAFDTETYWGVVTRTAAAADPACDGFVRRAFAALFAMPHGDLTRIFRLCTPLEEEHSDDTGAARAAEGKGSAWTRARLAMFLAVAFDSMAMGSYPYPSNYMTGGGDAPALPAWPMRAACRAMARGVSDASDLSALLLGLADAAGVYTNASGSAGACYRLPADDEYDGIWDYQWCTELLPQETYFMMDGERDMFWKRKADAEWVSRRCRRVFDVAPRRGWIAASTGGGVVGLAQSSNVVYSNGALDPWSAGGVMVNLSASVTAVVIEEGGHHTDLFFSDPADPPSVTRARRTELEMVKKWIGEWHQNRARLDASSASAAR